MSRPLVVTADPVLLDDLVRLAAAGGCEPEVALDGPAARRSWGSAPLVVVGADAAVGVTAAGLPKRAEVVVASRDLDDASVWQRAVGLGAEHVVFLPDAESWLVEQFAVAQVGRRPEGRVIGVVGGRGGAGATTMAVALAVTALREGKRTVLVDADPLGGGIDLVMGGEATDGPRWADLSRGTTRITSESLHQALPRMHELAVLSWDRGDAVCLPQNLLGGLLATTRRGADVVVVDLPRRTDVGALEAFVHLDALLVVVPAEVRATAAASRVALALGSHVADARVVVRGPAPSGLDAQTVAASVGLPLAGWLKPEPGLVAALERGEPPATSGRGPLATFARAYLATVLGGQAAA